MRNQVLVYLDKGVEFHLHAHEAEPMSHEAARTWLDTQFTALDCEPLRASGKLLTADKVLRVTEAAGPARFEDAKWAADYVGAVLGALGKPMVRVNVPSMTVTYP